MIRSLEHEKEKIEAMEKHNIFVRLAQGSEDAQELEALHFRGMRELEHGNTFVLRVLCLTYGSSWRVLKLYRAILSEAAGDNACH